MLSWTESVYVGLPGAPQPVVAGLVYLRIAEPFSSVICACRKGGLPVVLHKNGIVIDASVDFNHVWSSIPPGA